MKFHDVYGARSCGAHHSFLHLNSLVTVLVLWFMMRCTRLSVPMYLMIWLAHFLLYLSNQKIIHMLNQWKDLAGFLCSSGQFINLKIK